MKGGSAIPQFWHIEVDGRPFGPYSDLQLRELLLSGKISGDHRVRHPKHTQGLWMTARYIRVLESCLEECSANKPAEMSSRRPHEPQPNPKSKGEVDEVSSESVLPSEFLKQLGDSRRSSLSRRSHSQLLEYTIDPMFRHYATPWIVRLTWLSVIFMALLWLSFITARYGLLYFSENMARLQVERAVMERVARPVPNQEHLPIEEEQENWFREASFSTAETVLKILSAIQAAIIGLLWARVFLELVIVPFDISDSLKNLRNNSSMAAEQVSSLTPTPPPPPVPPPPQFPLHKV